jgi:protein-S-isoprenylcysteine O-methyltransferase Ste14
MTVAVNRTRMRDTRFLALGAILVLLFTRPVILEDTGLHELMEWFGYGLVIAGAFGRIWCTAYIGGWKTDRMITDGPYSVVRNPLYLFSILTALGIAWMTGRVVLIVAALVVLPAIYIAVVRREEGYLTARFGPRYEQYLSTVPRWVPNFALYASSQVIEIKPRFLLFAFRDAIWLLAAYPAIELIEYLHSIHWLPTLATFW